MSRLGAILDKLEGAYGEPGSATPEDPYALVLFLNSGYPASDERCAKGFSALKAAIGIEPEAILAVDDAALAEVMKAGGMIPEIRSQRLKAIAATVRDQLGGDLAAALAVVPLRARTLLKRFPTLGDPAADRILLFCNVMPEPAAPAGGLQVFGRLGLSEEGKDFPGAYRTARAALESGLPEDFAARRRAYPLLKTHGQETCRRSAPRCEACALTSLCPFFAAVVAA